MWKSTNTTREKEDQCIPSGCLNGQGKKTRDLLSEHNLEREQNRKNQGGLATGAGPS